jgi:hypothetical protein
MRARGPTPTAWPQRLKPFDQICVTRQDVLGCLPDLLLQALGCMTLNTSVGLVKAREPGGGHRHEGQPLQV